MCQITGSFCAKLSSCNIAPEPLECKWDCIVTIVMAMFAIEVKKKNYTVKKQEKYDLFQKNLIFDFFFFFLGGKDCMLYLSNIDCLQGNTTYITRTGGEGDICQSYCPEGSQYYYY